MSSWSSGTADLRRGVLWGGRMEQPSAARLTDRRVPTKGDFGWACLAGGRAVVAAEFIENRSYFGLQREAGYLWGTLRDESGAPLTFMRRLPDPAASTTSQGSSNSLGDKLILQAAWDGASDLKLRREARIAPTAQGLSRRLDGPDFLVTSHQEGLMRLRLGEHGVDWTERDLISVAGRQVGPGLQWYLPGRDDSIYYPTSTWQVAGVALGRRVQGFLFYEEAYVPDGGRLYVSRDPLLGDELHTTWFSWATRWDDDELEFGHFLYGHDRMAIAVIGNGRGEVRVPTEFTALVTRNADGYWCDRIDYVLDGEEWEMVAAPNGRMSDLGKVPNPQQEGIVRRKGEPREPLAWMAWGESVPHHGDTRVVRRQLMPAP